MTRYDFRTQYYLDERQAPQERTLAVTMRKLDPDPERMIYSQSRSEGRRAGGAVDSGANPKLARARQIRPKHRQETHFQRIRWIITLGPFWTNRTHFGTIYLYNRYEEDQENKFFFYEVYEDAAAIAHHKEQPHYAAWGTFKESGGTISSVSKSGKFMT
eukprot:scaffold15505_cov146-Skeletonema_dohrnii-CCMP3373.AAC.2